MPRPAQERTLHEAHRLHSIKEYIDYLAFVFSRDEPDLEEDLAQVAREAVVKKLRDDPDCPVSHLKVKAKSGIRDYRRKGKSVDGKLNETSRQYRYSFIDIDRVVSEDGNTLGDTLNDRSVPIRITEERALNRVLMSRIRSQLSAQESQALTLRIWGIPWGKIEGIFGRDNNGREATIRDRLEAKVIRVLTPFTEEQAEGG